MRAARATTPPSAAEAPRDPPTNRVELEPVARAEAAHDWRRTAAECARVIGKHGAARVVVQTAQFHLALSAERLGLQDVAFSLFSPFARDRHHVGHAAALRHLAALADHLPDAAPAGAALAAYPDVRVSSAIDALPLRQSNHVRYLVGRALYTRGEYDRSIAWLSRVSVRWEPRAPLLEAMCYVQARRSAPAIAALKRLLQGIGANAHRSRHLVSLGSLTEARIYYSSAIVGSTSTSTARGPDSRMRFQVSGSRLRLALRAWASVPAGSPLHRVALWESAWAHLALGEDRAALTKVRRALAMPGPPLLEAQLLEAQLLYSSGDKQKALARVEQLRTTWHMVVSALTSALDDASDAAPAVKLLDLALGDAYPHNEPQAAISEALGGKDLRQERAYLRDLDARREELGAKLSDAPLAQALALDAIAALEHQLSTEVTTQITARLANARKSAKLELKACDEFVNRAQ